MNLFMTIYLGHDRLLENTLKEHKFAMFNELCVALSAHIYINFAGNLDGPETEYIVGNIAIMSIWFIIVANLPSIIGTNFSELKLIKTKYYHRTPW